MVFSLRFVKLSINEYYYYYLVYSSTGYKSITETLGVLSWKSPGPGFRSTVGSAGGSFTVTPKAEGVSMCLIYFQRPAVYS